MTTDFVKQLKERASIAEIVGEYVRLRKTGSNHMGLCPFHAERSPSFSVVEAKGIYYCFGCHRGGDVISFVQEIQGFSFHDAVRLLAGKLGLKTPPQFARPSKGSAPQHSEEKLEIYYKLNRFVAQFYHERLRSADGKRARAYLAERGISDETISGAYLGYAPNAWSELYDFLKQKNAPMDKAEELGLIRRKETGAGPDGRAHYDLFRDRLMFPVTDLRGRVIAFGGRVLGDADGPKYLNSTESPVYKKGAQLFGLFSAQKDIRAEDTCVVVEGFMDCLSLQQAGIGYAVATLGTALTAHQVALLKRFTRNIVLLFDGDSAGQEAQARAMETFLGEDVVARGVALPDGLDPDEYVRANGREALEGLLKSAPYILDQRILELASTAGAHGEDRARALDEILPWVARIESDTARMVRLDQVAARFDVKPEMLERRVNELRSSPRKTRPASPASAPRRPARPVSQERPDTLDLRYIERFVAAPRFFTSGDSADAILAGFESETARDLASRLLASDAGQSGAVGAEALEWTESPALKSALTRALVVADSGDSAGGVPEEQREHLLREIRDLESRLARRGLERRKEQLRAVILKNDGMGASSETKRLMAEYNDLVRILDETKGGQVSV